MGRTRLLLLRVTYIRLQGRLGTVCFTSKQDMKTQTLNMDFLSHIYKQRKTITVYCYSITYLGTSFRFFISTIILKNQSFSCYVIPKSQLLFAVVMTILLLGGQKVHHCVFGDCITRFYTRVSLPGKLAEHHWRSWTTDRQTDGQHCGSDMQFVGGGWEGRASLHTILGGLLSLGLTWHHHHTTH